MSETLIYVVFGKTGEYSDHQEWPVRAFAFKHDAEAMVVRLTQRYHVLFAADPGRMTVSERNRAINSMKESDPYFQHDYTGTDYYIVEVPYEAARP